MASLDDITKKVLNRKNITKEEAQYLISVPLDELCNKANIIRKHFCCDKFDVCTIINIKNGRCSEDCKFCSQSIHYDTHINEYDLLGKEELSAQSENIFGHGFKRLAYVSSGRKISDEEFDLLTESIAAIKKDDINLCVSLGLLSQKQINTLKQLGVDRIHNNLETSEDYFKNICTTHSYSEKLDTLKKIQKSDLLICSGGIFGLGESFEDRIDLAFQLRDLGIKSIPINILHPIRGTPLENKEILTNDEVCRTVAIFRFINPTSYIRMAGGRLQLDDNGRRAFLSGANAAIMGNMLNTYGVKIEDDFQMIKDLGFQITYYIE